MDPTKVLSAFEVYAKKNQKGATNKSQVKPSKQIQKPLHAAKVVQTNTVGKKKKPKKFEKSKIKSFLNDKKNDAQSFGKNTGNSSAGKSVKSNNQQVDVQLKKEKKTPKIKIQSEQILPKCQEIEFDQRYTRNLDDEDEAAINPIKQSEKLFEWLIYPLQKDKFFNNNWEKLPLHIKRNKPKYYKSIMSTPMLDQIMRDNHILFTKNIDITSFTNDVRETHNPPGRALPSVVWDYYGNGCSVRMLNPQTYIPKLHTLNATLQEFFGCFVGSNSYLTPPNSQGFAPHYDDIEAFILQVEGQKRWRLYKPRNDNETLARFSSTNFSQKEIGEPILDTVVKAGDLLYFPRGTIHQGDTIGFDQHSLHVTLSVYQKNCWGDFLEKLTSTALKNVIQNDVRFRKGLPLNYLRYVGSSFPKNQNKSQREEFLKQTKSFLTNLIENIDIDRAADEMAKNHIHDFLPPVLDEDEMVCSVYEGAERMAKDGMVINRVEIEPDTFVRLSRAHCARLVEENGIYQLYYSCENSKEYHEFEPQFLEVDLELAPAIKEIINKYPEYVRVEDLPIKDLDKKIQIVRDLWEKAIVVAEQPLCILEE